MYYNDIKYFLWEKHGRALPWALSNCKKAPNPAAINLLKVNNKKTRAMCEICSKLTIKTPERRQWRSYGVFIVNFEQILHIVLVFPLLTLNK